MHLWMGVGDGVTGRVGGWISVKGIGHGGRRNNVLDGPAEHLYMDFRNRPLLWLL